MAAARGLVWFFVQFDRIIRRCGPYSQQVQSWIQWDRMLARERRTTILRLLEESGAVVVARLAQSLAVADETIRRDLAKLADEGLLVRTHGGAVRRDSEGRDQPFALRRVTNVDAKRSIARQAAALVRPGEVIGIDASTTGLELARQLTVESEAVGITVVSNGLDVVRVLAGRKGLRVVSTGGELDEEGACCTGPIAESGFERFALSRAFLSCKGYDAERGPTEASPSHTAIKQAMLRTAVESVLLVDESKLGKRSTCFVAPPDRFALVVTENANAASPTG